MACTPATCIAAEATGFNVFIILKAVFRPRVSVACSFGWHSSAPSWRQPSYRRRSLRRRLQPTVSPESSSTGSAKSITIDAPPQRIFSTGLAIDNILLSIVAPERVAGVTRFAADSSGSYVADKLAGHMMIIDTLNAELVVAARPTSSLSPAGAIRTKSAKSRSSASTSTRSPVSARSQTHWTTSAGWAKSPGTKSRRNVLSTSSGSATTRSPGGSKGGGDRPSSRGIRGRPRRGSARRCTTSSRWPAGPTSPPSTASKVGRRSTLKRSSRWPLK